MTRYLSRDRAAVLGALAAPLAAAAVLLPFRASWPNTNVALLLVVAVVGVAAIGSRAAGALAAVSAAAWFDFFFTRPYYRFTIRGPADVTTRAAAAVGVAVSQLAARARRLKVIAVTDAGYIRWDVELRGLPAEDVELRVFSSGQYHGRFMMTPSPGSRPSLQARLVALTLADLAGRALGTGPAVQVAP